jgi:competence protein ComEA
VRIDLNTASERTLQRLPGVGPAIAARIADYRNAYGGFREPREVMRVKGIGPKTFEKMAPYLFVDTGDEE